MISSHIGHTKSLVVCHLGLCNGFYSIQLGLARSLPWVMLVLLAPLPNSMGGPGSGTFPIEQFVLAVAVVGGWSLT